MKRLLFLFFIILGILTPAFAKDVRFIQVTDVHITPKTVAKLQNFVNDINKNFNDVDFVFFTGDNIDHANPEDLVLFLDTVKHIKPRVYVIPGNHDLQRTNDLTSDTYMKMVHKKLGFYHSSKPNYVFQKGGLVFITMNGVKEIIPGPNGYYKKDELAWLDKQLTKYKNKKVVILQHFPLLKARVKSHNLYGTEAYLEVLNKHNNVIAIVSGHYHENKEVVQNNVYNIVTKNFSGNRYYKLIEINGDDGFIYTSLIDNIPNLKD